MNIKKCVGAVVYSGDKIFLMESPKWNGWVIPGGRIEEGETEEEALKREIKEELGIEITNIKKLSETWKEPSADFFDSSTKFHFITFSVEAKSTKITTNHEISNYDWFTVEEAIKLQLVDSTRSVVEQYIKTH